MASTVAPAPEIMRTRGWEDYALLDSGDGRFTVVRPEPQCFWSPRHPELWDRANAVFDPTAAEDDEDAGKWRLNGKVPDAWTLGWDDVRFHGRLTAFRHLAFF